MPERPLAPEPTLPFAFYFIAIPLVVVVLGGEGSPGTTLFGVESILSGTPLSTHRGIPGRAATWLRGQANGRQGLWARKLAPIVLMNWVLSRFFFTSRSIERPEADNAPLRKWGVWGARVSSTLSVQTFLPKNGWQGAMV